MRKTTGTEQNAASAALFARHPEMKHWPAGHDFFFMTIDLSDIWLISFFGGASIVSPASYYKVTPSTVTDATQGLAVASK